MRAGPAAGTYQWAQVPVMTAVGVVTAVGLGYLRPLENTFPVYRELAQEMRTGHASSTFTPLGALVAALAFVRPNAVSLLPVVGVAAWLAPRSVPRRLAVPVTVSAVAALVMYSTLTWVVVGAPLFWPGNGPYNLFAGNNPASHAALVVDYNAEPSLPEGLAWCGVGQPIARVTPAQFLSCTRKFVTGSPVHAMQVTTFKIYNLLWRPNLGLAESRFEAAVQYAMVLPSLLWVLASAAVFARLGRVMDPIATAFVVAFVLPFALTNSDPRFRLPLDAVLVTSLAAPASVAALREMVVPWRRTARRVSSAP